MNTYGKPIPPLTPPAPIAPESLVDFALRDLTQLAPPPTPPTVPEEHLPEAELRSVLDQLAHLDPLSDFQSRERAAAQSLAEAQAAASGVKPAIPAKAPATAKGAPHASAKAHQPSQKWVTRRFA